MLRLHSMLSGVLLIGAGLLAGCAESTSAESASEAEAGPSDGKTGGQAERKKAQADAPAARHDGAIAGQFEWPQWRGPAGNDISSETGLITTFPDDGPKVVWRAALGSGFSGLSIAGGRLFTLFGSEGREYVACFDAATGEELWKVDSDVDFAQGRSFGPRAMPCVDGDRVYAVGASGQIFCLDVATGAKRWSFNIYEDFDMSAHEEGLSPSPLVAGEKLYLLAGKSAFAVNKRDGKLIWRALDEPMNHSSPTLATLDGTEQLLVLTGSNLVGLVPETGEELWRFPQQGVNIATPVVGPDNHVFVAAAYGFGNQLIQVSGKSPRQVYKENTLANQHDTCLLYEGCLYGGHERPGLLKCIDFMTGQEKWTAREPGKVKLILADGQLIMINEEGVLYLAPISSEGLTPTAEARVLTGTCYTAPSLAQGKLYLRSDQEMVCIEMRKP